MQAQAGWRAIVEELDSWCKDQNTISGLHQKMSRWREKLTECKIAPINYIRAEKNRNVLVQVAADIKKSKAQYEIICNSEIPGVAEDHQHLTSEWNTICHESDSMISDIEYFRQYFKTAEDLESMDQKFRATCSKINYSNIDTVEKSVKTSEQEMNRWTKLEVIGNSMLINIGKNTVSKLSDQIGKLKTRHTEILEMLSKFRDWLHQRHVFENCKQVFERSDKTLIGVKTACTDLLAAIQQILKWNDLSIEIDLGQGDMSLYGLMQICSSLQQNIELLISKLNCHRKKEGLLDDLHEKVKKIAHKIDTFRFKYPYAQAITELEALFYKSEKSLKRINQQLDDPLPQFATRIADIKGQAAETERIYTNMNEKLSAFIEAHDTFQQMKDHTLNLVDSPKRSIGKEVNFYMIYNALCIALLF